MSELDAYATPDPKARFYLAEYGRESGYPAPHRDQVGAVSIFERLGDDAMSIRMALKVYPTKQYDLWAYDVIDEKQIKFAMKIVDLLNAVPEGVV